MHMKAEVPSLPLNAWYLDGTLVGPSADHPASLRIVESEGPSVGLYFNRSKLLLFIPSTSDPSLSTLPPEVPVARRGFSLLHCPFGPPYFCEEVLQDGVRKICESLVRLHDTCDSHLETTLLRSCLALPKLSYIFIIILIKILPWSCTKIFERTYRTYIITFFFFVVSCQIRKARIKC